MNEFGVLTNRKRALIALIHSLVFLGIAMHGFASPKAGVLLRGTGATGDFVLIGINLIVASILAWLVSIAGCAKERVYFALCASSATFGLLRTIFGDSTLPAAQYLRVIVLTSAAIVGTLISRSFSRSITEDVLSTPKQKKAARDQSGRLCIHAGRARLPCRAFYERKNSLVRVDPELARKDPYGEGWLLTVQAPDCKINFRNLMGGKLARLWTESSAFQLQSRMPVARAERQQFHSSEILQHMQPLVRAQDWRFLAIADVDLYIPILKYVFDEAQMGGPCAVVSLHRLRQEFYGLDRDDALLSQRLLKECVHGLGHTLDLRHCQEYSCVMASSHAVEWIDLRGSTLCDSCRSQVELKTSLTGN